MINSTSIDCLLQEKREKGGDKVMKMTPSKLLNVVLVAILALSFFSIHTVANTSSYVTTDAGPEYDLWRDLNDDGIINIYDVVMVTGIYGSTGTPMNKTELLLELMERIEVLNATIIDQQNTINYLNEAVIHLNETVMILNGTGLGAPDYDSGWFAMPIGQVVLHHNLGTEELFIYVTGGFLVGERHLIEHWAYGTDVFWDIHTDDYSTHGVGWIADDDSIQVIRGDEDLLNTEVRVMIWKLPEP